MNGTRAIDAEIAGQPAAWRIAAARAAERAGDLPPAGARVAAVGCGTSLYVARAYAAAREAAGQGETDAFAASEMPHGREYDHVVAISRSGTTTEVIRLLDEGRGGPAVVLTADGGGPAARAAERVVALEFADEESVVQTRFATATLALLRAHLGQEVEPLAAAAEDALAAPLPASPEAIDHVVFLGRGFAAGIADEAALKLREAAGAWSESYPMLEYRHGPISVARPGSLVWFLPPVDSGLVDEVRQTGATVIEGRRDPMVELVLAQRLAVAVADARGLDPENPRHLSRSVVLDED